MTLSAALRRRRQRRNPVWPYFIVKDGVATCKHCNYNTKSVFSTNLKVHLRTHHHDLFEEVSFWNVNDKDFFSNFWKRI